MSIVKFLTSKVFLKQIGLALAVIIVICYLLLKWLNFRTNHGDFETVPDLTGKSVEVAKIELEDNNLVMEIQDSANFNPKYPKFTVIEQNPLAGSKVKEDRKIYLILNPSGYRNVKIPNGVIDKTYRQVKPTLESLGLIVGNISYVDNIGKDIVLSLSNKGKLLNAGDMLPKKSKIDLVLGNGNRPSSN